MSFDMHEQHLEFFVLDDTKIAQGSFTYYVRFLGGREGLRFCNSSNKEKIFSWKICNKGGGGGLKFRFLRNVISERPLIKKANFPKITGKKPE